MAKQSRKTRAAPAPTRKQEAFSRRDRQQQQRILIGVGVASVIIAVVLGLGLFQAFVGQSRAPVAKVNGVEIATGEFQKQVKYQRWNLLQTFGSLADGNEQIQDYLANQIPSQVLENMIGNELIRQEARQRNISVTQEEIDREVERQFGFYRVPPTPSPVPTLSPGEAVTVTVTPPPTATPVTEEAYKKQYDDYMALLDNVAGYGSADFRREIEIGLLRERIQAVLSADLPAQAVQIRARHIVTDTEEGALAIKARLEAGEAFAAIANQESTDAETKETGGNLGWLLNGDQDTAFDQVAFVLAPGQISEPVNTAQGWEIIEVLEREENRPLTPEQLQRKQSDTFTKWLTDQQAAGSIQRFLTQDKIPPMATAQPAG